ncbi:MAG: SulP family inorganic anion transporter [Acidimicrobiales bacterium]|nr:SulP family inorganic anion transporter [Acidimicrobiales bacterium]
MSTDTTGDTPAPSEPTGTPARRRPFFQGLLPLDRAGITTQVVAGITLAALAIPEVMGYATIAGMPVITGLYTIVLPVVVFAVLGSSRHLVVGADSATAAVMAAGLAGLAATGSKEYVALAGLLALMAAAFLLLARLVKLGFLADFLSRTVLIGFLTGVGVQVACGQVGGLLGIQEGTGITLLGRTDNGTIGKLVSTLQNVGDVSWSTVAVSAAVIVVILGSKYVTKKVPGALIAVIGAIAVSWHWDLVDHGVSTLGKVPSGLPSLGLPSGGVNAIASLIPTAISVFILILAQSAATSRAYAAKYNDDFDENVDLVGLGAANIAAGLSGTFLVNGSPTKTQMVDGAGGRNQVAQLTTGAIVVIVLLFLTAPLQYMPNAVLAAVVFLIGIELVDLGGMRRILRLRPDEFVVALATAVAVIAVGVEQGIILAIVLSVIDHLRNSYRPVTSVMVPVDGDPAWRQAPFRPDARTLPGLVVYRFAGGIYYANANHLVEDLALIVDTAETGGETLRWICIDSMVIDDVDYSGAEALRQVHASLTDHGVRLVVAEPLPQVRALMERYGLVDLLGEDAFYATLSDAVAAYRAIDTPPRST